LFSFGFFLLKKFVLLRTEYFNLLIKYCFRIKGKLEEQRPERVKPFMTGAAEQIKHILANFKNYQVNTVNVCVKDVCNLAARATNYLMNRWCNLAVSWVF